jgi:WD40 repeat protein
LELRGSTLGEPVEVLSSGSGPRYGVGVDPTGRWLATGIGGSASPDEKVLEIIDLDTGNIKTFPVVQEDHTQATGYFDWGVGSLQFAPDGSLYTFSGGGIRRWDLATGTNEVVFTNSGRTQGFLSADGRTLAIALNERHEYPWTDLLAIDTKEGISLPITSHGEGFLAMAVAIGPRGKVLVTGGPDGVVRAGPTTGEEPHLLLGHTENVSAVAISRDGRWLASATDGEIRLWPVPDIDQTPIHTLSRDQLLTTLDELTNLRALRDEASTTGWKLEIGPLPGWRHVPGW